MCFSVSITASGQVFVWFKTVWRDISSYIASRSVIEFEQLKRVVVSGVGSGKGTARCNRASARPKR